MKSAKTIVAFSLAVFLMMPLEGWAGSALEPESESIAPVGTLSDPSGLEMTFVVPGWLTGIDGTMGFAGLETAVDVPFYDLYKNLDMLAAGSLEVRKGRLGLILEGLYLKASFGGTPPGSLLSSVSISVEQVIAEAALTYRIFENDRAWLELLAGARYIYLGGELSLSVDQGEVRDVSRELSATIVDSTAATFRSEVDKQLPSLLGGIRQQVEASVESAVSEVESRVDAARLTAQGRLDTARFTVQQRLDTARLTAQERLDAAARALQDQAALAKTALEDRVDSKVNEIREIIRDRILEGIGSPGSRPRPELQVGDAIANSGRVREAIRDYVEARAEASIAEAQSAVASRQAIVQAQVEASIAAARAKVASQGATARANLESKISKAREEILQEAESQLTAEASKLKKNASSKVAKAEKKLAKILESEIEKKIPASPVSSSRAWVDPFVGFRGRYGLWDDWYLAGRADVGGFGVSSDLTLNLYGALGVQVAEKAALEFGYRYLSVDYQSSGFSYDVATKGPFVGVRIEF